MSKECDHDPEAVYFGLKNKPLKCSKCGATIKLSDDDYHDWVFCKNVDRDENDQRKYTYAVVDNAKEGDPGEE